MFQGGDGSREVSEFVINEDEVVPTFFPEEGGDPTGNRTRATTVKGWCPNR